MKRILLFLSMLLCLTAGNAQVKCNQGDQKPPHRDPHEVRGDSTDFVGNISVDPNEIIGPQGYDSLQWVSINDVMNYTIYFENDPEFATANAQKVDVRFDFQQKELMKDFTLGSFGFANMSWEMESIANTYQNRLNLVDSMNIYVDLISGLDVTKKQAFWKFSSIDPESGFAPWQSDRGMLPVNDSTHIGEGFVRFSIKPMSTMKTGDTISITANIVFDQNDTIPTNRWTNKIDAGNPESKVTAELHPTLPNVYNLKFTGKDDDEGSGVKHILLYMANQSGIYEEIDTCEVDSILAFPVEAGRQYNLYSIAVDNTGNREPAKTEPDIILNFNLAPTDILLSDTVFQDDLRAGGYIGKLSSVDTEDEKSFTYAMAEGEGAIHNDLFQIVEDKLQIKQSLKCADDSLYKIRISTTDKGGMTFSKSFVLKMNNVLDKPAIDTLDIQICDGDCYVFRGIEYDKAGIFTYTKDNDYMCDSVYVLKINLRNRLDPPLVSVEDGITLVSSAAQNNQWFKQDGTPVVGATGQKFTPEEDGVYYAAVSNGTCYSYPSQYFQVILSDRLDLNLNLQKGWNWISSSLTGTEKQDANKFIEPIKEETNRLVGYTNELINDPKYGLVGSLTTLNPKEGYKLDMKEAVTHTWTGISSKPEDTAISLHKGWNWIGYVALCNQKLSDALSALHPSENAIIKCEDAFATYTGGNWVGTLDILKPGYGYMYYAETDASFTYPSIRSFAVEDTETARTRAQTRAASPWVYNEYEYPDNTTLIAKLKVDKEDTIDGMFTVAAFCGDECRGVGQYVNGLVFITIHGSLTEKEKIEFKVYDQLLGEELTVSENLKFKGQNEGTVSSPFILNARRNIPIETASGYTVYPKPLRNTLYINGNTANIKSVQILSANGGKAISVNGYNNDGIDISLLPSGVYVVAVFTHDGEVYYEKVIKTKN